MKKDKESSGRRTFFESVSQYLSDFLDKGKLQPELVLVITSVFIGICTGFGAVAFRYLIQGVGWISYNWIPSQTESLGISYVIFVPAAGGLLVGLIIFFFAREAKGHGVPEVMEAVALRGGRIKPNIAVFKSLASSLSIGTGGSVGREGPIVQIGSAMGSTLGQILKLSNERVRNLVACGAAAGIAATFNAPIAGVIFALEVILREFTTRYFSTVVIASVSSSVIGRMVFGNEPAFSIPMEYGINSIWEYCFYPVLGVLAAFVGVSFVRVLYWSEDLFDKWKRVPEWVKPAIGGMMLGGLGIAYPYFTGITWDTMPQVFNVGYEVIEAALKNELALSVVVSLLFLKLIATSLTLGSGGSGGVFAPGLFMGAMLGGAFELLINIVFPGIAAPQGAYALVGMGAVFAATSHAPITAIIILFELTGNYEIILPLMLAVVVATLLSMRLMNNESIYTLKLSRRGVRLRQGRDVDLLHSVLVQNIMHKKIDSPVKPEMTLQQLSEVFNTTRHHGVPVIDNNGKLYGVVTVSDLDRAYNQGMTRRNHVHEITTPLSKLLVAYPGETIGEVLNRMSTRGIGRLPVVDSDDKAQLLGLIRRSDIIRAYNLALSQRTEQKHRDRHQQIENYDGTEFVDLTLYEDDACVNKTVEEVSETMPKESILISIRTNGKVLIPNSDNVLRPGQNITIFTRSKDMDRLIECLRGKDKADSDEEKEESEDEGDQMHL